MSNALQRVANGLQFTMAGNFVSKERRRSAKKSGHDAFRR
jgi:hypothetical protein